MSSTLYTLMRDARMIELDMLDCCELCFEDQPFPDYRPLLRTFSNRVGQLADELDRLALLERDGVRWRLLFEAEDVVLKFQSGSFMFVRECGSTRTLLSQGKTIQEAADKAIHNLGA